MQPTTHTLKTHPAIFRAARDLRMTFQTRKDDRAYQAGDLVTLTFHDPDTHPFAPAPPMQRASGSPADEPLMPITFRIGFVLRGGQYGIEPGYVAFSLLPVDQS